MSKQEQNSGNTQVITEEMAYQIAWKTFIPTPMPEYFFSFEDDLRYEHYAEHMYEIFRDVSPCDLEGTIKHLADDIVQAQIQ